jgi:hypothetical protein
MLAAALSAAASAALAGCAAAPAAAPAASGGGQGTVRGSAILAGRIPYQGHPFAVAIVSAGKVLQTAHITHTGGTYQFAVPAGSYQLALRVSGVPSFAADNGCTTSVTAGAGQVVTTDLNCTWH